MSEREVAVANAVAKSPWRKPYDQDLWHKFVNAEVPTMYTSSAAAAHWYRVIADHFVRAYPTPPFVPDSPEAVSFADVRALYMRSVYVSVSAQSRRPELPDELFDHVMAAAAAWAADN